MAKKGKKKVSTAVSKAAAAEQEATDEVVDEIGEWIPPADNEFKVPPDQWGKWNKRQRWLFNALYSEMTRSPSLFNSHPEARIIEPEQWRVIAWNAAWNAACV